MSINVVVVVAVILVPLVVVVHAHGVSLIILVLSLIIHCAYRFSCNKLRWLGGVGWLEQRGIRLIKLSNELKVESDFVKKNDNNVGVCAPL